MATSCTSCFSGARRRDKAHITQQLETKFKDLLVEQFQTQNKPLTLGEGRTVRVIAKLEDVHVSCDVIVPEGECMSLKARLEGDDLKAEYQHLTKQVLGDGEFDTGLAVEVTLNVSQDRALQNRLDDMGRFTTEMVNFATSYLKQYTNAEDCKSTNEIRYLAMRCDDGWTMEEDPEHSGVFKIVAATLDYYRDPHATSRDLENTVFQLQEVSPCEFSSCGETVRGILCDKYFLPASNREKAHFLKVTRQHKGDSQRVRLVMAAWLHAYMKKQGPPTLKEFQDSFGDHRDRLLHVRDTCSEHVAASA